MNVESHSAFVWDSGKLLLQQQRAPDCGCGNSDSHVTVRATTRQSPSSHTLHAACWPISNPSYYGAAARWCGLKPLTEHFRFSQRCCSDVKSSGMWHCFGGWMAADVSKRSWCETAEPQRQSIIWIIRIICSAKLQTSDYICIYCLLRCMYVMGHTVAGWTTCNCATKSSSTSTQKPHLPSKHHSCLPI